MTKYKYRIVLRMDGAYAVQYKNGFFSSWQNFAYYSHIDQARARINRMIEIDKTNQTTKGDGKTIKVIETYE